MAKKKEMNRTSGTARRKMSQAEQVRYGMKTGAPLTGSASGVKSISLKQAGEVLTQGIVSVRGKKLSFDPAGLAMALPTGKVATAGMRLLGKGKLAIAETLSSRLAAKAAGRSAGRDIAAAGGKKYVESPVGKFSILGGGAKAKISEGSFMRNASERVYPRAKFGPNPMAPTLREEYKAVKQGYEQVFGKGKKVSSFNPDIAAMTMLPGSRGSVAKIRKISNQVDAYLKKRGGKTIGK